MVFANIEGYHVCMMTFLVVAIVHILQVGVMQKLIDFFILKMANLVSFTLSTEIIIEAPPSIVWSIITDTRNYAKWNPFIREMNPVNSDKIMVGKDIQLICYKAKRQEARLESSHTQSFKAKIIEFLPEQKLSWTGCILSPLIFEGEHMFALDPITNPNGGDKFTRFIHEENFKGLLLIILKRKLSVDTRSNFIKMNEALKRVSEDAKINNE